MTAFVLEGIDRVGKTTLLTTLSGDPYNFKVLTVPRPSENGWETIREFRRGKEDCEKIIKLAREVNAYKDFILDRFSFSELVYAKVFGRACDFPWYEKQMRQNKDVIKLILVIEEIETIVERWRAEDKPTEYIIPIITEYNTMLKKLGFEEGLDYMTFKPTTDKIDRIIGWINSNGKNSVRSAD